MTTSIKIRAIAFVAAFAITFGLVAMTADYAYPVAPAIVLASAA